MDLTGPQARAGLLEAESRAWNPTLHTRLGSQDPTR